jgi:N-acetylglutamate synthase-like GNAT family acetyltransferase
MQHTALSADGKTCRIRRATADDTDQITRLIISSSIHAKALNRKLEAGPQQAEKERQGIRHVFFKISFFLFASRVQWRNYSVAVSAEGTVIGCCQIKPHPCGIREIDMLCLDRARRNGL